MSLKQKYFSRYKKPLYKIPYLVNTQIESFEWFKNEGVKDLLKEFSPISDYGGKDFTIDILDYEFGEPKCDEYVARLNNINYDATLTIRVKLTNKKMNETREQEIFLADFPIMTARGTFIINGVERVIVPQIARSFGVYFTSEIISGTEYFGAKIIPSRGAWIEFETGQDGVIYVRIDRKRKIPVTALLRVFGIETNEDIIKSFKDIDKENNYIVASLAADSAKSVSDAYLELYNRIRPGEMVTPENAKEYIDAMFSDLHYDLSIVGRYRLNHRLERPVENIEAEPRILSPDDIVAIIREVIILNNTPGSKPDDIDHLGLRRVRAVGELIQQRLRVGMARMKKNIQDRMSTAEPESLVPAQLINNRPLSAVIKEFFSTNQLSQFMSQKNILDELEHLRRLSALGPGGLTRGRAGFEVRDVHQSHYGRICPIQTPEGPNIGLVVHFAIAARLNKYGIIETPYAKVENGVITNEIKYLNALDESRYNIAHAGISINPDTKKIVDDIVEARSKGKPVVLPRSQIDFIDISANQAYSVGTSLIPFLEHNDGNRALMGSNMQKQAVPCLKPEAPYVATGIESVAARDSGRLILADEDGAVIESDASHIVIKGASKKIHRYDLVNFMRSNASNAVHQRPSVSVGDTVKKGDYLTDNYSTDMGQLSLGQNVRVAFMPWYGYNFEDAIIISDRLVKTDTFSSVRIEEFSVNIRDTKLGPEINTYDIPNVSEERLKDLDEDGIVRIGAVVDEGNILVGKITPKGEVELTPEEKLLRAIFGDKALDVKDTSLRLEHGKKGRVIGVKVFSAERGDKLEPGILKKIYIEVAQIRPVSVGDKLSGRHGNKGVVSRIVPAEDMPFDKDGEPVDVILNTLGVPSRMNLGQILETHLGMAAKELGYQGMAPAFASPTEEELKMEMKKAGIPESGKIPLYDGLTGERFENDITVGIIYMLKLDHMIDDKMHMRAIGPYSLITQQPLGGKAQEGGQRFGEMEVWALEGYGAAYTLQEMLTIKSDDIVGRVAAYESIIKGEPFKSPHVPAAFHVLVHEMRGLGLNVTINTKSGVAEAVARPMAIPNEADVNLSSESK